MAKNSFVADVTFSNLENVLQRNLRTDRDRASIFTALNIKILPVSVNWSIQCGQGTF